jgi:hypothetical protein
MAEKFFFGLFLVLILSPISVISANSHNPVESGMTSTVKMEWDRTFGGKANEEAFSIIQTEDGGFALAGDTASFTPWFNDIWLVRTDSDGQHLWNRTYGGTE